VLLLLGGPRLREREPAAGLLGARRALGHR
jgi:hypothetical protein